MLNIQNFFFKISHAGQGFVEKPCIQTLQKAVVHKPDEVIESGFTASLQDASSKFRIIDSSPNFKIFLAHPL